MPGSARRVVPGCPWHVRAIPLLIGGLLLLAACGGASGPATPAATTPPTSTGAATQAATAVASSTEASAPATTTPAVSQPGSAEEWISATGAALDNLQSFRTTTTMNETHEVVTEYARPGGMRMTTTSSDGTTVMTYIDDLVYTTSEGATTSEPSDATARELITSSRMEQAMEYWLSQGGVYALGGTETIDGVACQVVTMHLERDDVEASITYWIGINDHLPRKVLETSTILDAEDGDGPSTVVEGYYHDFNADIVIEAPA